MKMKPIRTDSSFQVQMLKNNDRMPGGENPCFADIRFVDLL